MMNIDDQPNCRLFIIHIIIQLILELFNFFINRYFQDTEDSRKCNKYVHFHPDVPSFKVI